MRARFFTQSIDFSNVLWWFWSFASASGVPTFFEYSSKYVKRHWFYRYLWHPHWAMLDHPREHEKPQNERHAAWELFPKMQNERHAAWERVFGRHGPDWSPQKGPLKTSQTVYFKLFWMFFGAPLEHPIWAHQKMEQPKWAPKSSPVDRTKHSFSKLFLLILFFGIVLMASPNVPFIFKIWNIAVVL